jgi:hypothetical protein
MLARMAKDIKAGTELALRGLREVAGWARGHGSTDSLRARPYGRRTRHIVSDVRRAAVPVHVAVGDGISSFIKEI